MRKSLVLKSVYSVILLTALALSTASFLYADDEKPANQNYALLLNGGGDFTSNFPSYDERLGSVYRALRSRGISKDNILVYSGSGKSDGIRQKDWTSQDPDSKKNQDYDRDGKDDVNGVATSSQLESVMKDLAKKMKPGDHLSLFITGPSKKELLSGDVKLKLWGRDVDSKDLGKLLNLLPPGVEKTIITDVPFGGEMTSLTDPSTCVLSAYGKKEVGSSPNTYFDQFSKTLSQEGATLLVSHRRGTSGGEDSIEEFLKSELSKVKKKIESRQGTPCPTCTVADRAKEDALKKALQDHSRGLSEESNVIELADVVVKERHNYFDGDLKERVEYFRKESYESRLNKIHSKMKAITAERAKGIEHWNSVKKNPSYVHTLTKEEESDKQRQEIRATADEEEKLKAQYQNLKSELRFILDADPATIESYAQLKKCATHAY